MVLFSDLGENKRLNLSIDVTSYYSFSIFFSEYALSVSCNLEMIFLSFFNLDLRAIIVGVRTKIVITTPKENKEKINKANDV